MKLSRLIFREISYRRLSFLTGLLLVAVAVCGLLWGEATIRAFDREMAAELEVREAEALAEMERLEDEMRKITKRLGFNVLVLPKDQNLSEFYADDYAAKTMPESYVTTLANSSIITITHLLPILQKKVKWEEQSRTILLVGVRGEVPLESEIADDAVKKPLLEKVPSGKVVLGYELHAGRIQIGDTVVMNGRAFEVHGLNPERGNKDDITAWIPLNEMQAIYGEEGRINSIMALQCKCAWGDLPKIREEIAKILPETQVIELSTQALARAEARWQASESAQEVLAQWKANKAEVRNQLDTLAAWAGPGLIVFSMVGIGALAFANVRQRGHELGILMAMGMKRGVIERVLVGKCVLMGVFGGGIGLAVSVVGWPLFGAGFDLAFFELMGAGFLGLVFVGAVLMAGVAGWVPCQTGAQRDPVSLLRGREV